MARRVRNSGRDPMKAVKLVSSILRTQVGPDERPSPMLKQLGTMGQIDDADLELAQDIALLAADIMDELAKAAADGNMRAAAMPLVGLLMDAVPELQADLQAVRN
jgi:hypothetical protein